MSQFNYIVFVLVKFRDSTFGKQQNGFYYIHKFQQIEANDFHRLMDWTKNNIADGR